MNLPSESVEPSRRIHRRTAIVGPSLIVVCVLHCAFAFMSGATVWQAALADGWVGAFTGIERQAVLWFLVTGLVGVVAGIAVSVVERRQRLPWGVTVPLTLVAVFGVISAPASGFWLVLAVAALGLVRSALPFRVGDEPR
ncbi:MAG: DUF6463 family protein [Leucobacter sp.]